MRNFYFQFLSRSSISRWAPLPLRLLVGYGFVQHGVAKLMKGPDTFAAILHAIGVPAPHFMAWLTILTELTGGIAVLLGAFIPLVSVPLAAVLLVAIFSVHLQYGFSSIRLIAITPAGAQFGPVGYETNLLYLAALLTLTIGGSGPLAIDRRLGTGEGRMKSRNPCLPTPSNPSSPPPPPTRADETDTRRQPTTPLA